MNPSKDGSTPQPCNEAEQEPQHVELLIIGSGSGNSLVTSDWQGRSVGIVEDGIFGGTCLNVGCIPTKMFAYAAQVADTITSASRYGIDARLEDVRWSDIRDRVFGRIDPIAAAGEDYRRKGPDTTAYLGRARFVGDRRVRVRLHDEPAAWEAAGVPPGTREVDVVADQVVIAAGAHADLPAPVLETGRQVHTSDTIMRLETLPRRLLILGGGYIACEFAHIFGAFGTQVTMLARGPRLLRHLDGQISERFTALARERWDVRT
ncbi:MAG: FAD-dependent oxidoreductase, partial [Micrococcales bacterium]|nr:FAD-dependent oxidoreductase [Micrococcales bacterium]